MLVVEFFEVCGEALRLALGESHVQPACGSTSASARLSSPPSSLKATRAETKGGKWEGASQHVRLMMKLRRDKPGGFSDSIRSSENPLDSGNVLLLSGTARGFLVVLQE